MNFECANFEFKKGQGVVDENLRFHDYDNLYAADVSVFPYIPTANPSLTLGALALRLSDHLQEQFGVELSNF